MIGIIIIAGLFTVYTGIYTAISFKKGRILSGMGGALLVIASICAAIPCF
ncbi:MAG: hypothetical protein RRY79_04365 [Clostridia bacterium]